MNVMFATKDFHGHTADSGRPFNANSCRVSFNSCTMTFLGRFLTFLRRGFNVYF